MSKTTIEIDDQLLQRAAKATGLKTKREIVHRALEALVRTENANRYSPIWGAVSGKETSRRCAEVVCDHQRGR